MSHNTSKRKDSMQENKQLWHNALARKAATMRRKLRKASPPQASSHPLITIKQKASQPECKNKASTKPMGRNGSTTKYGKAWI